MCSLSGSFPAKTLLTQVTAKESQVGWNGTREKLSCCPIGPPRGVVRLQHGEARVFCRAKG